MKVCVCSVKDCCEHYKTLQEENKQLKKDLAFVLEQVLGAFQQNWCIDWGFADIRKKYNLSDKYEWKKEDKEL